MVSVSEKDNGYQRLIQQAFNLAKTKPRISVGILTGERMTNPAGKAPSLDAEDVHPVEAGQAEGKKAAPVNVIDIAIWNEFGTWNTPSRSFIRAWFDESVGQMRNVLMPQMRSVIKMEITSEIALERVGLWAVGQIQKRIASGIDPENAQSTIDRKGSSKPLIDEGILRSSISYRVEF